jgi:hypothetical protein
VSAGHEDIVGGQTRYARAQPGIMPAVEGIEENSVVLSKDSAGA